MISCRPLGEIEFIRDGRKSDYLTIPVARVVRCSPRSAPTLVSCTPVVSQPARNNSAFCILVQGKKLDIFYRKPEQAVTSTCPSVSNLMVGIRTNISLYALSHPSSVYNDAIAKCRATGQDEACDGAAPIRMILEYDVESIHLRPWRLGLHRDMYGITVYVTRDLVAGYALFEYARLILFESNLGIFYLIANSACPTMMKQ